MIASLFTKKTNEEKAKETLSKSIEVQEQYLAQLRKELEAYDRKTGLSKKSQTYLEKSLTSAQDAMDRLHGLGKDMGKKSGEVSNEWVKSTQDSMIQLQRSMNTLKDQALAYDNEVRGMLPSPSEAADATKESAGSVKETVSTYADKAYASANSYIDWFLQQLADTQSTVINKASDAKNYAGNKASDAKNYAGNMANKAMHRTSNTASQSAEGAESYLASLKKSIEEYDKKTGVSETASSYMQSSMETAQAAMDELRNLANTASDKSSETSDSWQKSAQDAMERLRQSMDGLNKQAAMYDSRARAKVSVSKKSAQDSSEGMKDTISSYVASAQDSANSYMGMFSQYMTDSYNYGADKMNYHQTDESVVEQIKRKILESTGQQKPVYNSWYSRGSDLNPFQSVGSGHKDYSQRLGGPTIWLPLVVGLLGVGYLWRKRSIATYPKDSSKSTSTYSKDSSKSTSTYPKDSSKYTVEKSPSENTFVVKPKAN